MELAADEEAVLSCGDLALAADADAAGVAYAQRTYDVLTFVIFETLPSLQSAEFTQPCYMF